MLWLFREGVRSEVAGRWGRADFYWRESADAFYVLTRRAGVWDEVLRTVGGLGEPGDGFPDADGWLRSLVDELFIDTHCAFYNARVKGPGITSPDDRAFDHARLIQSWLNSGPTALTRSQRSALIGTPWELRLELARNAKRWDEAVVALGQLLVLDPDRTEYVDRMVEIECQRTFESLKNGTDRNIQIGDAVELGKGIDRLKGLRRQHPYNLSVFEALGHFHHVRAIKLANAGRASEALVESQRALDHAPMLEGAETTREEIEKLLQSFIERAKEVRRECAGHPGAVLNDDGRRLCAEADSGYQPFNKYMESGRSIETAQALVAAKNRDIWQRVGLPLSPDRFDERAQALVSALLEVFRTQPADEAEAGRAWVSFAERNEDLRTIDPGLAARFLMTCLPGNTTAVASANGKAHPPAEPGVTPPILEARAVGVRGGEAPFEFWLLSPRDAGIKALAGAAVVLLTVGAVLAASKARNDRARDDAYGQIVQSQQERDYAGMIRGIETFLDHPPLRGRDPREGRVRELYDEAMVRWFIARGGTDDAEVRGHVERFRRLTAGMRS